MSTAEVSGEMASFPFFVDVRDPLSISGRTACEARMYTRAPGSPNERVSKYFIPLQESGWLSFWDQKAPLGSSVRFTTWLHRDGSPLSEGEVDLASGKYFNVQEVAQSCLGFKLTLSRDSSGKMRRTFEQGPLGELGPPITPPSFQERSPIPIEVTIQQELSERKIVRLNFYSQSGPDPKNRTFCHDRTIPLNEEGKQVFNVNPTGTSFVLTAQLVIKATGQPVEGEVDIYSSKNLSADDFRIQKLALSLVLSRNPEDNSLHYEGKEVPSDQISLTKPFLPPALFSLAKKTNKYYKLPFLRSQSAPSSPQKTNPINQEASILGGSIRSLIFRPDPDE